jgi:DNA-binding transcriptional ArsR family regulator
MPAAADIAVVMRTLADPTRRAIYERIVAAGEVAAGALTRDARVSQPAVSQHLRALREADLVLERRDGRNVHYRAQPRGLAPLVDWLGETSSSKGCCRTPLRSCGRRSPAPS